MKNKLSLIKFKKDFRCFKEGAKIEINNPITLLVGDQGTGKSSILSVLQNFSKYKDVVEIRTDGKVQTISFDTEKDNPRKQGALAQKSDALMFQVASIFGSHGECLLPMIQNLETYQDIFIMVDEPESGLSIRSQYKILDSFDKAVENGCQILIATHSIVIMESIGNVFNMEKMKYQSSKDFIKSQKQ